MTANVNIDYVLMGGTKTAANRNLNVPVVYLGSNVMTGVTNVAASNTVSPASWSNNINQTYGHAIISVNGGAVRVTWSNTAANSTYGTLILDGGVLPVEVGANTRIFAIEVTI